MTAASNPSSSVEGGGEVSSQAKYQGSSLDDDVKTELMNRILDTMEESDEIYKEGFNEAQLVELVGANTKYVSQVINEKYQKGFAQLLSDYRIREACRRLANAADYGNLTIEGIGMSVGIRSRSNFVANFKRITGLTPSEYRKIAASKA